ncbi:MAG TPA: hypothetical protein VGM47_04755 [Gammaproteobacteria bacterium]|jgi:hypothetical protein
MAVDDLDSLAEVHLMGSGVTFRGAQPKWPSICIVCGRYCAETWEVISLIQVGQGRYSYFKKGPHDFLVPVHRTGGDCLARLRRPVPIWAWLIVISVALIYGAALSHNPRANTLDHWGMFILMTSMAFTIAIFPLIIAYPGYVRLRDLGGGYFQAEFKSVDYARQFVSLNRGQVDSST